MTGLDITLYVEQGEYISLSQEAGVRVLVHDQRAPPFPEDHGFSAATGQTIYVGITMVGMSFFLFISVTK